MTQIKNNINTYADITAYNNDLNKDYPNISYIQGTDEVKWVKDDPVHIVCKYNVTSTSKATTLLFINSNISYQIIDGVQQDTVQTTYTFDTLGEHTVKYKLSGTSIMERVFHFCSSLTSVTIPNSVTSIDNYVFQNCSGLKTVTIPNSVTSIGVNAFDSCSSLTSVTIPNSVTSISNGVFYSCSSLTSVTISDTVTSIGDDAFVNLINFRGNLVLPSTLTTLGDRVFNNMRNATSITFLSTTPPTAGTNVFLNMGNIPIYVPSESVDAYKVANNWSTYASRIQAIPNS